MCPFWFRPGPDLHDAAAPDLEPLFGLRSFDYKRDTIRTAGLSKMTDPGPGEIEGHPAPCPEGLYPDQAGIQALFQETMDRYGLVWGPPSGR